VPAPWHLETDAFSIRKVCVGPFENNVYIVACRTTGEAVIVDAAADPERILVEVGDVTPTAILTTHGHHDHVGAVAEVASALGVPFRIHPDDADLAGLVPDDPLLPGTVTVGRIDIEVIATPGHTPGSVSLLLPGIVLTGDTLFPGGPGATRGPGSSFEQILATIEHDLLTLPPETLVMPGHGLDTTIGAEAPSLEDWRRRGW
jgi:glyoxylase-like metal-dependent hydrolase (beta-lactamase superfamily II)